MKLLLVSDSTNFSTYDVYLGYVDAFKRLGVDFVAFDLHEFNRHHLSTISLALLHSMALIKNNGITHVLFVGGCSIPKEVIESFWSVVRVGIIATDDPHSSGFTLRSIENLDWYFTNERALTGDKIHYVPTAASVSHCGRIANVHERYKSDIIFVGSVYPNLVKFFEAVTPFCISHGINLKIVGHIDYVPADSIIRRWCVDSQSRTVPHDETLRWYSGAKAAINLHRDPTWHPETDKENPYNLASAVPESLNPRAYELALCGCFQLLDDSRAEARDYFDCREVGFFSDPESFCRAVTMSIIDDDSHALRKRMIERAAIKVQRTGTYDVRAKKIIDIINQQREVQK